jgi:homoserine kinase
MKKWSKEFKSFRILVPGSISNLGCGFDTLGLAISLYFKTSVHSSAAFHFEMKCNNKPLEIPAAENLFLKVLRSCYPVSPDDWNFTIHIDTEVPPRRGLGSSACAAVSAILLAARLLNLRQEPHQIIQTAQKWEAHPDNLCASVYGGFTAAMQDDASVVFCRKLSFPDTLRILLLIPEWEISTEEARQLLPQLYPQQAVVANLQRLAYFIACLQNGSLQGLRESVRDQIHQPYRAPLIPFGRELLDTAALGDESALFISGSGPTFAVLYRAHENDIRSRIQQVMAVHEMPYELRNVIPDQDGARIESLED